MSNSMGVAQAHTWREPGLVADAPALFGAAVCQVAGAGRPHELLPGHLARGAAIVFVSDPCKCFVIQVERDRPCCLIFLTVDPGTYDDEKA